MKIRKNQKGFTVVEIVLVVAVLALIGFTGWKILSARSGGSTSENISSSSSKQDGGFIWRQANIGWESTKTPPDCPAQPMLSSPSDISSATAVLYPGQTRGGNYKPHGGFRYDNAKNNSVEVKAPIDGYLVRGSRYIEVGETQYMFDIFNNCGVMFRVDHIREIPPNLQKVVNEWPAPTESSATNNLSKPVLIKKGEILGTQVGFVGIKNVGYDFGVYDYRQQNQASKSPAYQSSQGQHKELSFYAVCWLKDWLPSSDQATIASLPAGDGASGKTSDYCK